jgi:hypothetical protein
MMTSIQQIAEANQQKAWQVIRESGVIDIWKSYGAQINLIGSLRTGLLVKKRDIDFHIYTDPFALKDSFAAVARLAENPAVQKITYVNLLKTSEMCLEWHAWYQSKEGDLWEIDMIHLLKESPYAGVFEALAEKIAAVLTPETRAAIMEIKYTLPEEARVMGIQVCKAVIQDGVRTLPEFMDWKEKQKEEGIITWEL